MTDVFIWGEGRTVKRRICPIRPHTLVQGSSSFHVRLYTEGLAVVGLLMLFKLVLLVSGQVHAEIASLVGTVLVPLALTWLSARLAEGTHFLITTQGVETERGRMDFVQLDRITVALGTLTLHGRDGETLTLTHMRAPLLLREVIWTAKSSA
ncbi:MAG: hypothetical protein AAFQ36_00440 [Pseudomonadota bacterium]